MSDSTMLLQERIDADLKQAMRDHDGGALRHQPLRYAPASACAIAASKALESTLR